MPTTQPPDVPAGLDPKSADYMRRLSTWAYQELDKKHTKNEAASSFLLTPSDQKQPNTVFQVTVDSAGNLSASQLPLGSGKP